MSSLKAKPYRMEDQYILQVWFESTYNRPFDNCVLSFKCNDDHLEAISTSIGRINSEGNIKTKGTIGEFQVAHCKGSNDLECVVGYYTDNELLDYEVLRAEFDDVKPITKTELKIPYLKTIPGSMQVKFKDFFEGIRERQSSWKFKISFSHDLLLEVDSVGNSPTIVVLGKNTQEVCSSDYIFQIDPNVSHLNIPVEIIRNRHSRYERDQTLGIYEVIEPDFLAVKGLFYKKLVSNTLLMSEMAKAK